MTPARAVTFVGFAFLPLALSAPEGAAQESQVRDVRGFDAIEVRGNLDLEIRQGDGFLVEVLGPADSADSVITVVGGTTLEIRRRQGSASGGFFGFFAPDYEVAVTLPVLRSVSAGGGADVVASDAITGETLTVSAGGGSDVVYRGNPAVVDINTTGGSDLIRL